MLTPGEATGVWHAVQDQEHAKKAQLRRRVKEEVLRFRSAPQGQLLRKEDVPQKEKSPRAPVARLQLRVRPMRTSPATLL